MVVVYYIYIKKANKGEGFLMKIKQTKKNIFIFFIWVMSLFSLNSYSIKAEDTIVPTPCPKMKYSSGEYAFVHWKPETDDFSGDPDAFENRVWSCEYEDVCPGPYKEYVKFNSSGYSVNDIGKSCEDLPGTLYHNIESDVKPKCEGNTCVFCCSKPPEPSCAPETYERKWCVDGNCEYCRNTDTGVCNDSDIINNKASYDWSASAPFGWTANCYKPKMPECQEGLVRNWKPFDGGWSLDPLSKPQCQPDPTDPLEKAVNYEWVCGEGYIDDCIYCIDGQTGDHCCSDDNIFENDRWVAFDVFNLCEDKLEGNTGYCHSEAVFNETTCVFDCPQFSKPAELCKKPGTRDWEWAQTECKWNPIPVLKSDECDTGMQGDIGSRLGYCEKDITWNGNPSCNWSCVEGEEETPVPLPACSENLYNQETCEWENHSTWNWADMRLSEEAFNRIIDIAPECAVLRENESLCCQHGDLIYRCLQLFCNENDECNSYQDLFK